MPDADIHPLEVPLFVFGLQGQTAVEGGHTYRARYLYLWGYNPKSKSAVDYR